MKRCEYFVVLSGEGKLGSSVSTQTLHPFFDHELVFEDIERMKAHVEKVCPNYHWNVSFIHNLSVIEPHCVYRVEFKAYGLHGESLSDGSILLPAAREITERREEEALNLFKSFLETDSNFESTFEITDYRRIIH